MNTRFIKKTNMDENALTAVKQGNVQKLANLLGTGINLNAKDANNRTLLHHAVHKSRGKVVKFLIDNGADVLLATDKNNTPLHIAVTKNDEAMTTVLLENVSREKIRELIDTKTKGKGSAVLHVAASDSHYEIAKILLAFGANFEIQNNDGKKPLDLVNDCQALREMLNFIETCFKRAKSNDHQLPHDLQNYSVIDFPSVVNSRNNEGHTIIQVSILDEHYLLAALLIRARANSQTNKYCPLFDEERKNDVDRLAEVAEKFKKYWYKKWGKMDLYVEEVYRTESNFMADRILEEGSYSLEKANDVVQAYKCFEGIRSIIGDPNILTVDEALEVFGFKPEHLGIEYRHTEYDEMAEFFASKGQGAKYYDMLHGKQKQGVRSFIDLMNATIDTPITQFLENIYTVRLFEAVKNDDITTAKQLLFKNAHSNAYDYIMRTPLAIAAARGNEKMIRLLLEYDAEVNSQSKITALHTAVDNGHVKIVELLLQKVPDDELAEFIDRQSFKQKLSALHGAARKGYFEIVKILLRYGATYCILDFSNNSPFDICKHDGIRQFLKFVDKCFSDAKNGNNELIKMLENRKRDELLAVTNTRDRDGNTLAMVAAAAENKNIANEILTIITKANTTNLSEFFCFDD